MNVAQLTSRLEALLREASEAPGPRDENPLTLGSEVRSSAELRTLFVALGAQAKQTLDVLGAAPAAAFAHWDALPPLRAASPVRVRRVLSPTEDGTPSEDALRFSELASMHLVVRDGAEALLAVPTSAENAESDAVLAIHATHPALVDYLMVVFESAWAHALPQAHALPGRLGDGFSHEELELLDQLLLGLTDSSIARALGVSVRTVQRRAQALQRRLGVSRRFQLGMRVGLDGFPAR
ncbi:LuxR C-terminal-related transcriptional regulator [Leucobacter komagatae]|uniref:LuxR C-terminal-related transcriptional regulator n=1 Tax=Leucobacter komagatae TaxID=55969 RepID=UPI00147761A8|nr:LuxR C-terminal-related transcriptional regulator [Leucobacter komagatae]